jgi:hypothetical protein
VLSDTMCPKFHSLHTYLLSYWEYPQPSEMEESRSAHIEIGLRGRQGGSFQGRQVGRSES